MTPTQTAAQRALEAEQLREAIRMTTAAVDIGLFAEVKIAPRILEAAMRDLARMEANPPAPCADIATHPGALLQNSSMGVRKVIADKPVLCAVDEDMYPETLYICRNMLAHTTQEDERPTVEYMRKDDTQGLGKMRKPLHGFDPGKTYAHNDFLDGEIKGWNAAIDAIIERRKSE